MQGSLHNRCTGAPWSGMTGHPRPDLDGFLDHLSERLTVLEQMVRELGPDSIIPAELFHEVPELEFLGWYLWPSWINAATSLEAHMTYHPPEWELARITLHVSDVPPIVALDWTVGDSFVRLRAVDGDLSAQRNLQLSGLVQELQLLADSLFEFGPETRRGSWKGPPKSM